MKFVDLMQGFTIKMQPDDERMEQFWLSDQWILEPIRCGRRFQCLIGDEIMFSTKKEDAKTKDITGKIPHVVQEIKRTNIPVGSLVDGYVTTDDKNETLRMLEVNDEKSLELQRDKRLQFIISDVIYLAEEGVFERPLFDRKKILKDFKETENIKYEMYYLDSKYDRYLELKGKYERLVLKNFEAPYTFGKSAQWRILSECESFCVVIMDIIEGAGKFQGMCGALRVGQYRDGQLSYITNIGTGLNYDDRIVLLNDKEKYINKVIEIKAVKTAEKFNEARFHKFRDDVNPFECIKQEE